MELYPKIRPYKKGYLKLNKNNLMYYEVSGNTKGKPILFVHGGPGGRTKPDDRRYFNPKKFKIILFDQRGCGKSKPFGIITNNTTQNLVNDIIKLLNFLRVKKVVLFGGSWGSTLSLIFAIKHPEKVSAMLLKGVFLATKENINFYMGKASKINSPKVWKRFLSFVPVKRRSNVVDYYWKQ